jgi:hypothetical protein
VRSPMVGLMEGAVSKLLEHQEEILLALEEMPPRCWRGGVEMKYEVINDVRKGLKMLRTQDAARKVGK